LDKKNINLLSKYGILTERELEAHYAVLVEQYCKTINIEAETLISMAKSMVLPVALKYQNTLAEGVSFISKIPGLSKDVLKTRVDILNDYSKLISSLKSEIVKLESKVEKTSAIHEEDKKAEKYCKEVLPAMSAVRSIADKIEEEVEDSLWPMPKYREMLFIY